MRVAIDGSSRQGRKTGIGVYTENLLGALRTAEPDIDIFELNDGADANQRTDRRIWREQFALPRLARQASADILHLPGFAAPARASCPVVLTVHDLIGVLFARDFPPVARFYWSRWLPFTLRFPNILIANSEHTRKDVINLVGVPPDRIRVVYPGRDERFRPIADREELAQVRAEMNLPEPFLLFVGTLEPRKGVDTLIRAFARLASEILDSLVIVGKRGWYWEQTLALVDRLGLGRRIRLLDYVPDGTLPLLYNLAHAFVFPSRYEGFGLPVLEAMACGIPVVSSNAASLPEIVGDAGLLFPPDNVDALSHAIVRIVGDAGLRASLRECGLRQARRFDWTVSAHETAQVYRETYERASRT